MSLTRTELRDGAALLILRAGLVWFIFLWAAHKIITPGQYQNLAKYIDGVEVSYFQIYAMAALQIALCIAALIGAFRPLSYGGLLLMHFYTVTRRWEGFFDPFALNDKGFPINRNQVIDLAALAAFIALVLLMHRDHLSLGAWRARHGRGRWWM